MDVALPGRFALVAGPPEPRGLPCLVLDGQRPVPDVLTVRSVEPQSAPQGLDLGE
jgi:hypothetical protein